MRGSSIAAVVVVALASTTAHAGNDRTPRTPPIWNDAACATIVDRSQTSEVVLEYGVLEDDVNRQPDEPPDSRTFQFFAFSQLDFAASSVGLPNWITQDDIDEATQADAKLAMSLLEHPVAQDDVLESTGRFAAQDWVRINADDARVPITAEQAAMGVRWDIGGVPAGSYAIFGYTWEPQINLWTARPGFVKVIDDAAHADAAGPSIALKAENARVETGEPHTLSGCIDTPDGSTLTIEWGEFSGVTEPQWRELVVDAPIDSGMLALDIVFPAAAGGGDNGRPVKLRATLTDPRGRARVTWSPGVYAVLGGPADEGGSCTVGGARAPAGAASLALLALVGLRRRRAGATLRA